MALVDDLEQLLAPLLASQLGVSATEGPEQLEKLQEYLTTVEDPSVGFRWLGERIETLPPTAGCWVGVYLGGLVERGRLDAADSAPGVARFFRGAVAAMTAGESTDEWEACAGLLGPAIVTQLSVHQPTTQALAADSDFVDQVEALDNVPACHYVSGLLRQRSGEFVLLDPEHKRALLISFANVGSCFHLFTLLQSVLSSDWSGGRSQPADMLAAAWGENAITEDTPGDMAWFHYSLPVAEPNIVAMVPGEATLDAVGRIGDQAVLTVFPSILAERAWHANFFAPQLNLTPPSVSVVRELSHPEVLTLLGQLR